MQWKGQFEVKGCKVENNHLIEINQKMKTFHSNLLKQYVERYNVKVTATPGRWDFPRKTQEEARMETGIEVQGVQGANPRADTVGGLDMIVLGVSANNVKEQENVSVDDKKLLELEVLRPKKGISDVCL